MTQPSTQVPPGPPPAVNGNAQNWRLGALTLEVGVPNFVMQLFNGELIVRLLTLKMFDDYSVLPNAEKRQIIWKVAVVGLLTLGVCAAAIVMNPLFIWAVPLCLITTTGLAFSLLTLPPIRAPAAIREEMVVDHPQWGRGHVLGRAVRR